MSHDIQSVKLHNYLDYILSLRTRGEPLTSFNCPHCDERLETLRPENEDDIYDTFSLCPYCDGLYFKVAYFEGDVEVTKL